MRGVLIACVLLGCSASHEGEPLAGGDEPREGQGAAVPPMRAASAGAAADVEADAAVAVDASPLALTCSGVAGEVELDFAVAYETGEAVATCGAKVDGARAWMRYRSTGCEVIDVRGTTWLFAARGDEVLAWPEGGQDAALDCEACASRVDNVGNIVRGCEGP